MSTESPSPVRRSTGRSVDESTAAAAVIEAIEAIAANRVDAIANSPDRHAGRASASNTRSMRRAEPGSEAPSKVA